MRKIKYDSSEADDTNYRYDTNKHYVDGRGRGGYHRHNFTIRYNKRMDKGERYRVLAGCRNFTIPQACDHWFYQHHHSRKQRIETLKKLFKMYKVEKRRIPKQYRKALGY